MSLQDFVGADLSEIKNGEVRNIDIVFCIDATGSMGKESLIDKVKQNAYNFYGKVENVLKTQNKTIGVLRVKVIAFRDYYCDGDKAMSESEFFNLPEQNDDFKQYLDGIKATGGGDAPESSLEALALAMKSSFTPKEQGKGCPRHIIVLFTDSSAHPFQNDFNNWVSSDDESNNCSIKNPIYPKDMFKSLEDLKMAWEGMSESDYAMTEMNARRLLLFAPVECYPWSDLSAALKLCICTGIEKDNAFNDLDMNMALNLIANSAK